MSTRSVSITSEGIGKVPVYLETNEKGFTPICIGDKEFELWRLYHDDNCIAFEEHVMWTDFEDIVSLFLNMFPNKVFELHSYCHDGYGYNSKCALIGEEIKEWDYEEFDIGFYDPYENDWDDEDGEGDD